MADLLNQRIPDGSRPLITPPKKTGILEDRVADRVYECEVVRHRARINAPLDPHCRVQIQPGEHYLEHTMKSGVYQFCAPCAIDWYGAKFGVRESDVAPSTAGEGS